MEYRDDLFLLASNGAPIALDSVVDYLEPRFDRRTPVVFYLHGRGNEPDKSLKARGTVADIEKDHGVDCVLVSWDSKAGGLLPFRLADRERPIAHAGRGAEKLGQVLGSLSKVGRRRGRLSLLVHSMGNIVLQKAVEQGFWQKDGAAMFDNVLMTAPDTDAQGHSTWLQPLARVERVFVTINGDDGILRRARELRTASQTPLGLGRAGENAPAATYLDFTGLVGAAHRVFAKGAMNQQAAVLAVIRAVLRGEHPPLDDTIVLRRDGNLVALRADRRPGDPAFRGVVAPEDDDD